MSKRYLALIAVGLAACGQSVPDADIRDVRPLQVEREDKITVEACGPIFTVGAPTTVTFDNISLDKDPLKLNARAVGPSRVLFDADQDLENRVAAIGGHVLRKTTVTVEQQVGGKTVAFRSAPKAEFEIDLFPRTLHKLSQGLADRATGNGAGALWKWLGVTLTPSAQGLVVSDIEAKFDKDQFFLTWDTPPLDGKITRTEAKVGQPGGLTEEQFKRLDKNGDGVIATYETDEMPTENGLAAAAGLQSGDLILTADGKKVASLADLGAIWNSAGDGKANDIVLNVQRGTTQASVTMPVRGRPMEIPAWIIFAICMALVAGLVALPVPVIGGLIVVWERKISAYMQSRIGPNRVGPNGWLQWLADGLKLIMKEDLIPTEADPILFRASPYLAFVALFLVFMVLPFTQWIVVADLNVGLLFLVSVTSLMVVSIIMGGWSSNSKWSLLGGMRSAAQIISYELPASVALLTVATLTGSLSTESIVRAQGGSPWNWNMFHDPFTYVAFFIYFISALAEANRTPFDLPEAESELVSGYNTEYSGFRFALFPLVEWVNLFVIGAVAGMLFCGGWRIPGMGVETQDMHWYWQALGAALYLGKILFFIFVIIWIRWTLPRFRVDQMMNLCWKFFIPISFACFVGVLLFAWVAPWWLQVGVRWLTFLVGGVAPLVFFLRKVQYNRSRFQELKLNPLL
jgi:NADH-quinone oxidoreductase subunit H